MRRLRHFPFYLFLAALLPAVGVVAYWAGDNTPPRVIHSVEVLNDPVTPGEPLRLLVTGHALKACPVTVNESIADSNKIVAAVDQRLTRFTRKTGPFSTPLHVPTSPTAAPGPAIYTSHACYQCNFLHRWFPICIEREVKFEFGPSPLSSLVWPNSLYARRDAASRWLDRQLGR